MRRLTPLPILVKRHCSPEKPLAFRLHDWMPKTVTVDVPDTGEVVEVPGGYVVGDTLYLHPDNRPLLAQLVEKVLCDA